MCMHNLKYIYIYMHTTYIFFRDDISISPKKDVMITSSEINQVEKM